MTARTTLTALAAVLACTLGTGAASASDFGISFSYSSHSPYYYTTTSPWYTTSRYYTTCTPRSYVYYDNYSYCDPVVYPYRYTPSVVLYDNYYTPTYRTTYTRSRCYTPPVRHVRRTTHYRSGHRTHYYRRDCSPSRGSITLHRGSSGSYGRIHAYRDRSGSSHGRSSAYRGRSHSSYGRGSAYRDRGRSSHDRGRRSHDRQSRSPRLRIHRR